MGRERGPGSHFPSSLANNYNGGRGKDNHPFFLPSQCPRKRVFHRRSYNVRLTILLVCGGHTVFRARPWEVLLLFLLLLLLRRETGDVSLGNGGSKDCGARPRWDTQSRAASLSMIGLDVLGSLCNRPVMETPRRGIQRRRGHELEAIRDERNQVDP
ncbi:hypothetical protein BT69DRAFT_1281369 [Atractiella rhizophila]|nr:hypothetical protein BT69DRAFT_1281369 [Atractiella rhizophila]